MVNQCIKSSYLKIAPILPNALRLKVRLLRNNRIITKILGPQFEINLNSIEIDITYDCNLKCFNCNRACSLVPSKEAMSVKQIQKFVDESIKINRKWRKINIMGGEPTLHPNIFEIVDLFLSYKRRFSPQTDLVIVTNNFGTKVNDVLSKLPEGIRIRNGNMKSRVQKFKSFHLAPADFRKYRNVDYINGCSIPWLCGMALTLYGYYPCAQAAAIDRVFGFNLGEKTLPLNANVLREKLQIFCKYCGHFKIGENQIAIKNEVSPSWERACEKYRIKKPSLSLY